VKVTVAYALPARQWCVELVLGADATARDALQASGLMQSVPELAAAAQPQGSAAATPALAVFGRAVAADQRLRDGDRVEVLRSLQADPKEVRRKLAAEGRAMGRRRPGQP
jgi:putative ubiquitin-RnfH superfamily antitoxin RatB of RatAB toxin-antitoxin module